MAGRIPIYRRVGDVLRLRPGKADRGICTSCHTMPSRALPLPPRSCPKGGKGGFGPCITSHQSASARIQRSYRRGTRPDRNRARCSLRHGHRCLCGTSPTRVVRDEWPARAEELCCTFRAAYQPGTADCPAGAIGSSQPRDRLPDRPDDPPRRAQKRAGPGNRHPRLDRELEPESAAIHLDQDR
jgi:hypothetical protein